MWFIFMLLGLVLAIVGSILLVVALVKHKSKKIALIILVVGILLFFVGVALPSNTNGIGSPSQSEYSDSEKFAAEFCMAYMKNLKNPYSFKIKSIQVYNESENEYEVFVKFTAENGFGAEIADEIGSMGTLNESDLKAIATGNTDIFTWPSEPTNISLGKGEKLDASKIQSYIDENY